MWFDSFRNDKFDQLFQACVVRYTCACPEFCKILTWRNPRIKVEVWSSFFCMCLESRFTISINLSGYDQVRLAMPKVIQNNESTVTGK